MKTDAILEGRMEWTPVSEGDAAGPIVVAIIKIRKGGVS